MFNVDAVTELEAADQRRRNVRAQKGLICDQLLQTFDRKRVLGADVHGSCVTGRRSATLMTGIYRTQK